MKKKTDKKFSYKIVLFAILLICGIYGVVVTTYPYDIATIVKTIGWTTYSYGNSYSLRYPVDAKISSEDDITTISVSGALLTIAGPNAIGDAGGQGYDPGYHTNPINLVVNNKTIATTEGISSDGHSRVVFQSDKYRFIISYPDQNQKTHEEVQKILSTLKIYK